MKIAVQMDHISTIHIAGDTTFALCLEAQNRGYELFHYTPDRLSLRGTSVTAGCEALIVRDIEGDHFHLGPCEHTDLSVMDVVLLRQDPPFDMNYITTTHILERIHPKTLVVNDPASVRNAPEKILVMEFPDLMPETLITKDLAQIRAFRREFGDIIIKPLYGNGGAGVFHLTPQDDNLTSLVEMFAAQYREAFIVQRYLPQVREGDKRIILTARGCQIQHACGRTGRKNRPNTPRKRNMFQNETYIEKIWLYSRRHRCYRGSRNRDQCDIADRLARSEAVWWRRHCLSFLELC